MGMLAIIEDVRAIGGSREDPDKSSNCQWRSATVLPSNGVKSYSNWCRRQSCLSRQCYATHFIASFFRFFAQSSRYRSITSGAGCGHALRHSAWFDESEQKIHVIAFHQAAPSTERILRGSQAI